MLFAMGFSPLSVDQAIVPHPIFGTVSDPTWLESSISERFNGAGATGAKASAVK